MSYRAAKFEQALKDIRDNVVVFTLAEGAKASQLVQMDTHARLIALCDLSDKALVALAAIHTLADKALDREDIAKTEK